MNSIVNVFKKPQWQIALLLFFLILALLPASYHSYDRYCFLNWANYIASNGIGNAYSNPEFNYPPLIAYPLQLFAKFQGSPEKLDRYFHYFKLLTLLFDFAAVLLMVNWLAPQDKRAMFVVLLLNPLFLYNTLCWGQVDGVPAALILFSLYAVMTNRPAWALIFLTLAINFKLQTIIFIPLIGLLFIWKGLNEWKFNAILIAIAAAVALQTFILIPFIKAGQLHNIITVLTASVDHFPTVSMNAFNLWALLLGNSFALSDQTPLIFGLTYKQTGLILFCIISFIVLFPVLYGIVLHKFRAIPFNLDLGTVLLMFSLIALAFFYFNTQMHERYSHFAILFVAAYCVSVRRFYLLALILVTYTLNLEAGLRFYNFPSYTVLIFNARFVASLFAMLLLTMFFLYYRSLQKVYTA
jgi:Gpi18-like mannosyltransferase